MSTSRPELRIVGAGMAGLVAALQAQAASAPVTLVEKGDAPGGSRALSGGTLWCAKSYEDLGRLVPRGDPLLGRVLIEDYAEGVAWLQSLGATLTPLPPFPTAWSTSWNPPRAPLCATWLTASSPRAAHCSPKPQASP